MTQKPEHECNTCRWYDPMEGYCTEREVYRHGYDGDDCDSWTQEEDTRRCGGIRTIRRRTLCHGQIAMEV